MRNSKEKRISEYLTINSHSLFLNISLDSVISSDGDNLGVKESSQIAETWLASYMGRLSLPRKEIKIY